MDSGNFLSSKIEELKRADFNLRDKLLDLREGEKDNSSLLEEIKALINGFVLFISKNLLSERINEWLNDIIFSWKTILLMDFRYDLELNLPVEYQIPATDSGIVEDGIELVERTYQKGFWLDKNGGAEDNSESSTLFSHILLEIENTYAHDRSILSQVN
jgi:hypothetical protein